ncbi:hypothetical protein N8793_00335 [Pseudomonadales bacterium]|nr:hypothetical protein [Pseudomonadales bacterium]
MEIINQIDQLKVELHKVIQGEDNTVAINNLDSIYSDIAPSFESLADACGRRELFSQLPDEFSIERLSEDELASSHFSVNAIGSFMDLWGELDKKHEINQHNICSDTRDSLYKLSSELEANNTKQYKAWLDQMLSQVQVSEPDLEEQERSPNLKENALEYRSVYQDFLSQAQLVIPTETTIERLKSLSQQLIKHIELMEFDQPEDVVKLFKHLKQVGSNGAAPISMLTPQVIAWMEDKGEEANFYIGHKRMDRRR